MEADGTLVLRVCPDRTARQLERTPRRSSPARYCDVSGVNLLELRLRLLREKVQFVLSQFKLHGDICKRCGVIDFRIKGRSFLIRSESVNNMEPDRVMYLVVLPSRVAKIVLRKVLFGFCGQWLIISSLSYQLADFVKKEKEKKNKGRIKVENVYCPLITCQFAMKGKKM